MSLNIVASLQILYTTSPYQVFVLGWQAVSKRHNRFLKNLNAVICALLILRVKTVDFACK